MSTDVPALVTEIPAIVAPMPLPSDIDPAFPAELVRTAARLNADPLDLANILYVESNGIHAAIVNAGGCVGINQFCPVNQNARALPGWPGLAAYRALPASAQLRDFVAPWWGKIAAQRGLTSLSGRDLYWLNFTPAWFVAGAPPSHVITRDPAIVAQNPRLSLGKSYIAVSDIDRALAEARQGERWNQIAAAVRDAEGGGGWAGPATATHSTAAGITAPGLLAVGAAGWLAWWAAKRWGT
jgi:hypothetical protein